MILHKISELMTLFEEDVIIHLEVFVQQCFKAASEYLQRNVTTVIVFNKDSVSGFHKIKLIMVSTATSVDRYM